MPEYVPNLTKPMRGKMEDNQFCRPKFLSQILEKSFGAEMAEKCVHFHFKFKMIPRIILNHTTTSVELMIVGCLLLIQQMNWKQPNCAQVKLYHGIGICQQFNFRQKHYCWPPLPRISSSQFWWR